MSAVFHKSHVFPNAEQRGKMANELRASLVNRSRQKWELTGRPTASSLTRTRVAVLISGALGRRPTDATAFRRFVIEPLRQGGGVVAVFACLESNRSRFARTVASWPETRLPVYTVQATDQFDRLGQCFSRTVESETFDLYIRTRPDALWYGPIAVPTLDAVTARARILFVPGGTVAVPEQLMAWRCEVFRGPTRCSLLDDQLAMVPWRYRNAYFLGTCTAPHAAGECPAGAWTRDRAIELQRRGEHGASDPLLFPAYQENTVTARLRACGVPVRIAPSPQYLAVGVMPVRPRWGNCTPHERAMGPGNTSAALADEARLTQNQMLFQTRASTG